MEVLISQEDLNAIGMSSQELRIEIAVHLYDLGKFTIGQASKFANLDQLSFQAEMAKREVYFKYTVDDLADDLGTLRRFNKDLS